MAKVCFDYGHGGRDPGAVYKGRKESDDNLALGKAVAAELRKYGVAVVETRTGDKAVSLKERSDLANKSACDYFISFHRNAFKPEQAKGVETYTYFNAGIQAKSLAEKIQTALVEVGFTNRGVKTANFHVLRETKAPAVLVETGFIDNTSDNLLFDSKRDEVIKALVKAILSHLGISVTPQAPPASSNKTLYRVMAGSFAVRRNAEKQVERLKAAGFDATIMIYKEP